MYQVLGKLFSRLRFLPLVPASFAVPVENSTVVVGNSATVECAVEGDNPITGTRHQIWMEQRTSNSFSKSYSVKPTWSPKMHLEIFEMQIHLDS